MINPEFCRLMARYNRLQNSACLEHLSTALADRRRGGQAARRLAEAGVAEGIARDQIWLTRLGGAQPAHGAERVRDLADLRRARIALDGAIEDWAETLIEAQLTGQLWWHAPGQARPLARPFGLCVMEFFTHQTLLRGRLLAEVDPNHPARLGPDLISLSMVEEWA